MVPLRVFCFAAAMLHAAAAPWAAMSCPRPPLEPGIRPSARRCNAANGPPDQAPDHVMHFTRDRRNAPLRIGVNPKKTPYIVCFAQTKAYWQPLWKCARSTAPCTLSSICQAAISPQHCLLPAAIDLRLRHSKPASEISAIYGTTTAWPLLQNRILRVGRRRLKPTSTGKFQCAA